MSAPPTVGTGPHAGPDGTGGGAADPTGPSARPRAWWRRTPAVASLPGLDDRDAAQARPDPAASVVEVGQTPAITAPVRPGRPSLPPPPTDTARGWIVTLVLTLLATVVRLWELGLRTDGGTPLFDEKYYALQAAEVIRNGGVEDNQAFGVVVHPPLGKQIIALGELILGYTPAGWRLAPAVAGIVCVLIMVRVVRRMTRSTLLGGIAGLLLICDGVSHVQSRSALLDILQTVFVLGAFSCIVADRDQVRARLGVRGRGRSADPRDPADPAGPADPAPSADQGVPASTLADADTTADPAAPADAGSAAGPGVTTDSAHPADTGTAALRQTSDPGRFGPVLGARWWRFAAGVLLGLAIAIKWSGVYWVAGFGVMVVIWDITARRDAGVARPVRAVVRRDLGPSLWSLAVVPLLTYVATWWAWFASADAWPRNTLVATSEFRSDWKSGLLYQLGSVWDNALWQWTWKMLDFHSHLLTPTDPTKRHPWESKPWTWPLGTRPVNYYSPGGGTGCGDGRTDCVQRILLIGTPALWWAALFVAAWALWKAIGRLDWRFAAVLVGYGAGYLPWFTNLDRQMYFFYATPLAPFLVIGITLVLGDILGRSRVGVERRYLAVAVVAVYVGLVVANFAYLWPILNGVPITPEGLQMRTWLPSWG